LRRQVEDAFGVEEASILMDRPPGGWNDLVTTQILDLKIDALRSDMRAEMAELSASVDRRLPGSDVDDDVDDDRRLRSDDHARPTLTRGVSAALRRGSRWRA
jgi:hypothetical protein